MKSLLFDPECLDKKPLEKLKKLEKMLTKWNKNINLVSHGTVSQIWSRHIVDSLQLVPQVKDLNKLADMGTGVGFPAIPLAIACPAVNIFAIEPQQKKCVLANQLIRELGIPNIHLLPEKVHTVYISHVDAVCCRAFGEFSRDARLAYKMLKPGGHFLTFKALPESVAPIGYEKVENHRYQLDKHPRDFFIVTAQKIGENE